MCMSAYVLWRDRPTWMGESARPGARPPAPAPRGCATVQRIDILGHGAARREGSGRNALPRPTDPTALLDVASPKLRLVVCQFAKRLALSVNGILFRNSNRAAVHVFRRKMGSSGSHEYFGQIRTENCIFALFFQTKDHAEAIFELRFSRSRAKLHVSRVKRSPGSSPKRSWRIVTFPRRQRPHPHREPITQDGCPQHDLTPWPSVSRRRRPQGDRPQGDRLQAPRLGRRRPGVPASASGTSPPAPRACPSTCSRTPRRT